MQQCCVRGLLNAPVLVACLASLPWRLLFFLFDIARRFVRIAREKPGTLGEISPSVALRLFLSILGYLVWVYQARGTLHNDPLIIGLFVAIAMVLVLQVIYDKVREEEKADAREQRAEEKADAREKRAEDRAEARHKELLGAIREINRPRRRKRRYRRRTNLPGEVTGNSGDELS